MTREYFQDILPAENNPHDAADASSRSIRNIAPSANRPRMSRMNAIADRTRSPRPKQRSYLLWGLVAIAIIVLGIAAMTLLRKTTVTLVPREHTVVFDQQAIYTAYPAGDATAPSGSLTYTAENRTFDDSTPVTASGTEQVSVAASGSITVYNAYSAAKVPLIKNTRFETPDGKIYRINSSITIPGKTATGPGSLTVTVYADQPGADYNIGPVERFTVPGLKNSPDMYAGIYAHSDSAMTGGFAGTRPAIAASARAAVETQLQSSLKSKIVSSYADASSGYALVPLADITYSPISVDTASDGSATAHMSATVVMPTLSRTAMDSFLAAETSASTGSTDVHIADPSTFSFVTANASSSPRLGTDPIDFSLSGNVVFVWQIDTAALAKDLAGRNKAAFQAIVAGYPSIDSASAKVYPLWSQSFPSDPAGIKMVVATTTPKP